MPEVTLTTRPSLLARSAGKAARVNKMGATRSTSIMSFGRSIHYGCPEPALRPTCT
jgi:hypothetical protein